MSRREYPKEEFKPFWIVVKIEGYNRRLKVLQTLQGLGEAHYQVIARNKTLKFSTNKFIVDRKGVPNFPWTRKLIEGQLNSQSAYDAIVLALEADLRGKKPPHGGLYAA